MVEETIMEEINRLIDEQIVERDVKWKAYNVANNSLTALRQQRERLLYKGMTQGEYLSYLQENPIIKDVDGIHYEVQGWNIWVTFEVEGEYNLTYNETVYKDKITFKVTVKTKTGKYFVYNYNDVPKKYEEIINKIQSTIAEHNLKMIEPDDKR
jgi:hypothetical protein